MKKGTPTDTPHVQFLKRKLSEFVEWQTRDIERLNDRKLEVEDIFEIYSSMAQRSVGVTSDMLACQRDLVYAVFDKIKKRKNK